VHEVGVGWVREFGPSVRGWTHLPRGSHRSQGGGSRSQDDENDIEMMDIPASDLSIESFFFLYDP
jgi:hypothetical protein